MGVFIKNLIFFLGYKWGLGRIYGMFGWVNMRSAYGVETNTAKLYSEWIL